VFSCTGTSKYLQVCPPGSLGADCSVNDVQQKRQATTLNGLLYINDFISFADGIKRKVQADELTQQGCKQDVLSILCTC